MAQTSRDHQQSTLLLAPSVSRARPLETNRSQVQNCLQRTSCTFKPWRTCKSIYEYWSKTSRCGHEEFPPRWTALPAADIEGYVYMMIIASRFPDRVARSGKWKGLVFQKW